MNINTPSSGISSRRKNNLELNNSPLRIALYTTWDFFFNFMPQLPLKTSSSISWSIKDTLLYVRKEKSRSPIFVCDGSFFFYSGNFNEIKVERLEQRTPMYPWPNSNNHQHLPVMCHVLSPAHFPLGGGCNILRQCQISCAFIQKDFSKHF